MKKIFTLLLAGLSLYCQAQPYNNTVNLVIGDQSFVATFGVTPDENISEQLRIQTHLSYVEGCLRMKDISHLNEGQRRKRAGVLDLLHTYWVNGNFPANYDYPGERRPCFIDRDGNICAVGYLVEQTAGTETAQDINAKHQYDYIEDMQEEVLVAWANEHGLTLEECAMIQPSYGWQQPLNTVTDKGVTKEYGISSAIVSGSNLALSMLNLSSYRGNSKLMPYIGLVTGAGGIVLGIMNIKKDEIQPTLTWGTHTNSYKSRNNLSYLNIAMGTASVVSGTLNLLLNRKERRTVLNVYSSPGIDNSINMGFTLTKRI